MWEAWERGVNGKPSMQWLEATFPPKHPPLPCWRDNNSSSRRAYTEYRSLVKLAEEFAGARRITPTQAAQILQDWHPGVTYINSLPKLRSAWMEYNVPSSYSCRKTGVSHSHQALPEEEVLY